MGSYIFQAKELDVMDYISYISKFGQPIDEVSIVMLSRMLTIPIGILMDGLCWTTRQDHDWDKINVVFSWHGKLQFQDMKWKSVDANGRYFLRGAQPRSVEHPKPKPPAAPSPAMPSPAPKKEAQEKPDSDQMDSSYSLRSKGSVPDVSAASASAPASTLQIKSVGLPCKKVVKWSPPVCKKQTFEYNKDLNAHLKEKHARFRFPCQHCSKI